MLSWNNKKKSLSPGCKEMLLEKMKEIETFNASRVSAKARDYEERSSTMSGKLKEIMKPTFKKVAEKVKYPEKVSLFKKLKYKFEKIEKEEIEKKFIFSYGVGDVTVEERDGNFVIPNVHYTPEVTLNVRSYDLLEEQGYTVEISNNKCYIHYMFCGKGKGKAQVESVSEDDGLREVVTEHNKFLDKYFESIEPKDEGSLVKGLEELKWDRDDEHDYVDEEYISWNGSLYATKKPWYERKPKEDVVENSSGNARVKDPQGKEKDDAGKEVALEEDTKIKTYFGVRLVGNMEKEAEQGSITDSNDFEVIV
uniref:ARID DNA-binding domain-containing protein n=1 Tax=Tanacetum cinerariifolium TaxID=118510 RepID=A0A6L2KC79_TANCI|nr:ARID DNA-binding domain-containing protein [Tanacetum cinerariifolium]